MRMHILLCALFPALVSAHGYLSSPAPRGIEKESYKVDDLKSPNHMGLCRGEPVGKVHPVTSGGTLTLGFTITAPHVGPCEVHLLDFPSMSEISMFAKKPNCAATGAEKFWTIDLPKATGRKVLRWTWLGCHVTPCEPYEQCVDVDFGGSSSGASYGGGAAPSYTPPPPSYTPPSYTPPSYAPSSYAPPPSYAAPSYAPPPPSYAPPPPPQPSYGGGCVHGSMQCDGTGFTTCVYGNFVKQPCATGTHCVPSGSSILCVA